MARNKTITLGKALERYVEVVSIEKKGWMQELYRSSVIKKYEISDKFMHEISSVDIAEYRDERLNTVNIKTNKLISGNTVRLELAMLSALFKVAEVEWGVCKLNPVTVVRKPKVSKGRDRRLKSYEERKIAKFLKEESHDVYTIFYLAIETAMRQGEILGLAWENINLQIGVAHLPETKNGTWRDVPLSKKARELLQNMSPQVCGNVFKYTSNGFKSKWRKSIKHLKIEDLHFHDLRHEAISRLFELGTLNMMEVAAISGHKSLNMLKRYTHLRAYQLVKKIDSKKKTVNKIASYFVPYPAIGRIEQSGYHIQFLDFEEFEVFGESKEQAVSNASLALLKRLAIAAQSGSKIPMPGDIIKSNDELLLINPLM